MGTDLRFVPGMEAAVVQRNASLSLKLCSSPVLHRHTSVVRTKHRSTRPSQPNVLVVLCRFSVAFSLTLLLCLGLSACQPLPTHRNNQQRSDTTDHAFDKNLRPESDDTSPAATPPQNQDSTPMPVRRKIPTLREQMEHLQAQQEQMNSRLDSVQTELQGIRQKVDEMSVNSSATPKNTPTQEFSKGDPSPKVASPSETEKRSTAAKSTKKSSSIEEKKSSRGDAILPDGQHDGLEDQAQAAKKSPAKGSSLAQKSPSKSAKDKSDPGLIMPDEDAMGASTPKKANTPIKKPKRRPPSTPKSAETSTPKEQSSAKLAPSKTEGTKSAPTSSGNTKTTDAEPKSQLDAAMSESPAAKQAVNPLFTTAMSLFSKKQYQESIDVLNQYTAQEKNAEGLNRAQYWIGESYYGMAKYDDAIRSFNKVLAAKSAEKSSKAMSMIAESMIRLGKTADAKKTYQRLLKQFPQSEEAVKAAKRLQQL